MTASADVDTEWLSMVPPAGLVQIPMGADVASRERRAVIADAMHRATGGSLSEVAGMLDRLVENGASRGAFMVGVLPLGGVATVIGRAAELAAPPHETPACVEFVRALAAFIGRTGSRCAVETISLPCGPAVRRLDTGTVVTRRDGVADAAADLDLTRVLYLLPSSSGRRLITLSFAVGGADPRAVLAVADQAVRSVRWSPVDRADR